MMMLRRLTVWRIVAGLMAFWLFALMILTSFLYETVPTTDESLERQLFDTMQNLKNVRTENEELKENVEHLRRMKENAKKNMSSNGLNFGASKHSSISLPSTGYDVSGVASDHSGEFHGEPSLAAETYRRAVENDVVEMWYYLQSQLTQLKHQLEAADAVNAIVQRVADIIETGVDYKRQGLQAARAND